MVSCGFVRLPLIGYSMNDTVDIFVSLLRRAVTVTDENIDLTDADLEALYSLSDFHDLTHIVYYELEKLGKLPVEGEIREKLSKRYDRAVFNDIRRKGVIAEIRELLNGAGIPFILLKGAVLMDLYPQSWMRTSSDVDVLIREEDLKSVDKLFAGAGIKRNGESAHDITYTSRADFKVEIHHSLIEERVLPEAVKLLEKVWEYSSPIKKDSAEYVMRDSFFYFYHLAHMAKHIKEKGCGVRFFADQWVLDHRAVSDAGAGKELVTLAGLETFEKRVRELSEVWFSRAPKSGQAAELEAHIMRSGLYGTVDQMVTARTVKTGKRGIGYYFRRVFIPSKSMKEYYPVLKKYPLLMPFYRIKRVFKLVRPDVRTRTIKEMKAEKAVDEGSRSTYEKMISGLGI